MLADTPLPRGFGAALASVDTFFPRAPEQFVTSPLCLVGYVRWDARSDRVPPLQTIIFSSFTGRTKGCRQSGVLRHAHLGRSFTTTRDVALSFLSEITRTAVLVGVRGRRSAARQRLKPFRIPSPLDPDVRGGTLDVTEIFGRKFNVSGSEVFFKAM